MRLSQSGSVLLHWPPGITGSCRLRQPSLLALPSGSGAVWLSLVVVSLLLLLPRTHSLAEFLDMSKTQEPEPQFPVEEDQTYLPQEPVFLTHNLTITAREGDTAKLPCTIRHLGTKKVAWRKVDSDRFLTIADRAWTPDQNLKVEHTQLGEELDDWTLVLPVTRKSDAGHYECQLTAVAGHHAHVWLRVVGPPLTSPAVSLDGTKFVERGGQVQLQCNATGGRQVADIIEWFKDGNLISSTTQPDYDIRTILSPEDGILSSSLRVERAGSQHAGNYVCRSSHNQLKDILVQVLTADSNNVKRGMSMDSSSSLSGAATRISIAWSLELLTKNLPLVAESDCQHQTLAWLVFYLICYLSL